jgi:pimeloyl-ACP methyl ester carboxylesterase
MPFVNNNGVKIHYEVEGQGPAFVLQHGYTYSIECWYDSGFVRDLRSNYQLVMVDARGHGQSDKSYDPKDYTAEAFASDYVTILNELGIKRAHYYGYSMGGATGFRCIFRYALPYFCSFILGGNSGYSFSPEADKENRRKITANYEADLEKGMQGHLFNLEKRVGPLPYHEKLLNNDINALIAWSKAVAEWPIANDILGIIKVPCLLFCGAADSNHDGVKETASRLPNARFISLPGLTHGDCIDHGDIVIPIIKQFLDEVNRG